MSRAGADRAGYRRSGDRRSRRRDAGWSARPAGAAGAPGGSSAAEPSAAKATAPTVSALERLLRRAPIPVVARVSQDSVHLDVLALADSELEAAAESVAWALEQLAIPGGAFNGPSIKGGP